MATARAESWPFAATLRAPALADIGGFSVTPISRASLMIAIGGNTGNARGPLRGLAARRLHPDREYRPYRWPLAGAPAGKVFSS